MCAIHGGKSPGGAASPNFKDGRYSKFLPTRLAAEYNAGIHDPTLVSLRDELALVDVRIRERVGDLDRDEPAVELWKGLGEALNEFKQAEAIQSVESARLAMNTIEVLIKKGSTQADLWDDILELVDRRRKLVDTESRREMVAHSMISAEQMILLVGMLIATVREALLAHVSDATVVRAVLTAIQSAANDRILGGNQPITVGESAMADEVLEQREAAVL